MKLLVLVTVCFAAVFAVDSSNLSTEPVDPDISDELQLIAYRNAVTFNEPDAEGQDTASGQNIIDFSESDHEDFTDVDQQVDDMSELLGRARRCRKSLSGRCQDKKYPCKKGYKASPKGRPYCTSKDRICCFPAPPTTTTTTTTTTTPTTTTTTAAPTTTAKACSVSQGEFKVGDQCFKLNLSRMTWTSARSYCTGIGLDLAQPEDPWAVHQYMQGKKWMSYRTWIGAVGTGSCYQWLNGTCISNSSPLWGWGPNGDKSSIWAVDMHGDTSSSNIGKPLDADRITDSAQVLCERK